jgi:hypothetical protein
MGAGVNARKISILDNQAAKPEREGSTTIPKGSRKNLINSSEVVSVV